MCQLFLHTQFVAVLRNVYHGNVRPEFSHPCDIHISVIDEIIWFEK